MLSCWFPCSINWVIFSHTEHIFGFVLIKFISFELHKVSFLFLLIRRRTAAVDRSERNLYFIADSPHSQRDIFTNKLKINSRYCSYLDGYNLSRNDNKKHILYFNPGHLCHHNPHLLWLWIMKDNWSISFSPTENGNDTLGPLCVWQCFHY